MYQKDRTWSDIFIPAIKRNAGQHLLQVSSFEVDTQQAADLVVLHAKGVTLAARVRRHGFLPQYKYDFTIRSSRDSGAETELAKIEKGFADYLFYGHAKDNIGSLASYMMIDLDILRENIKRMRESETFDYICPEISNHDGTYFRAFDVRRFDKELVFASCPSIY